MHPNEDENGGDIAETFLEYTTRWINKANRGGLFKIADNVYQTYYAMEVVLRTFLKDCIVNVPKLQQEVIENQGNQGIKVAILLFCLSNQKVHMFSSFLANNSKQWTKDSAIRQFRNSAIRQFGDSTIRQFGDSTIRQFANNLTIREFNNSRTQQFDNSGIQQLLMLIAMLWVWNVKVGAVIY